jgi:hypothetical protein
MSKKRSSKRQLYIPSDVDIDQDLALWRNYAEKLLKKIERVEEDKKRKEMIEINKPYLYETSEARERRAHQRESYSFIPSTSDRVHIDDIWCDNVDTCWYRGNLDRLDDYKGYYFLPGPIGPHYCDVCFDHQIYLKYDDKRDGVENL